LKRKGNPKYSHHQYAYTGLIKCGECGGVVSATFKQKLIKKTGELKSYALYYCVNARKKRLACSQSNYTNVEQIEDKIEEFTTSLVMIPGFQELALEMLEQEKGKEKDDTKTILETQQKTLFNIEKQLTNLTQLRIREMISDEEFIKEKTRLQNEQVRLQTQLNQTEKTTINWVELTAKTFEFASYAHKAFLRGSAEIKKSILSAFSLNCTLKDKIFSFEALEWFLPIQEFNKTIDAQIGPFEPEINLYTVRQKEILLSFSPQLRGLVYTVGTKLVSYKKQNEKFSIPDLKDNHDPP
jgi:predicted metal-binding protein